MTCALQGANPISVNASRTAPALAPGTTVFHQGTMASSERIEPAMGSPGHPPQRNRRLKPEPASAMVAPTSEPAIAFSTRVLYTGAGSREYPASGCDTLRFYAQSGYRTLKRTLVKGLDG
jgi:hypothetical protein